MADPETNNVCGNVCSLDRARIDVKRFGNVLGKVLVPLRRPVTLGGGGSTWPKSTESSDMS